MTPEIFGISIRGTACGTSAAISRLCVCRAMTFDIAFLIQLAIFAKQHRNHGTRSRRSLVDNVRVLPLNRVCCSLCRDSCLCSTTTVREGSGSRFKRCKVETNACRALNCASLLSECEFFCRISCDTTILNVILLFVGDILRLLDALRKLVVND